MEMSLSLSQVERELNEMKEEMSLEEAVQTWKRFLEDEPKRSRALYNACAGRVWREMYDAYKNS